MPTGLVAPAWALAEPLLVLETVPWGAVTLGGEEEGPAERIPYLL